MTPEEQAKALLPCRCENTICDVYEDGHYRDCPAQHRPAIIAALAEKDTEIERLRMQLAACGIAAQCNTEKSITELSIGQNNPYYSASYQDVCNAVKREMTLRTERDRLKQRVAELENALGQAYADLMGCRDGALVRDLKARVAELEAALKAQAMVKYEQGGYCFCDKYWGGRDMHSDYCLQANAALEKGE